MGLFDKLKNMGDDEDDALALGVATGTTPEVWLDDAEERDGDDEETPDAGSGERGEERAGE